MSDDPEVWVSPIDRHFHYGDAGRAECAVCCLEAERDRLRAVVRRAQEAWALHVADDPDEYDGTSPALIEWMAAWDELRELDVSPETGGGDEVSNTTPGVMAMQYRAIAQLDESPAMGEHKDRGDPSYCEQCGGRCEYGTPDTGRHVTATGKVLTDADIQALADEAERGYDVSHLSPQTPEQIAEVRARRAGGTPAMGGHSTQQVGQRFLSNACIHEEHDQCEQECSFCNDTCGCPCHATPDTGTEAEQ